MAFSPIKSTVSFDDGIEPLSVEVIPSEDGNNIEEINGQLGNTKVCLDKNELAKLPFLIDGADGNLSDKIRMKIRGGTDSNGNVEIFVTALAETVIQLKLTGKMFPQSSIGQSALDSLNHTSISRLARIASGNRDMEAWIGKLIKFWNTYKFMFSKDAITDGLSIELTNSQYEMAALRREVDALKREVNELKSMVKRKNKIRY